MICQSCTNIPNLEVTSKFCAPKGWYEASCELKTPQIFGASIQELVARNTWPPEFVHNCHIQLLFMIVFIIQNLSLTINCGRIQSRDLCWIEVRFFHKANVQNRLYIQSFTAAAYFVKWNKNTLLLFLSNG